MRGRPGKAGTRWGRRRVQTGKGARRRREEREVDEDKEEEKEEEEEEEEKEEKDPASFWHLAYVVQRVLVSPTSFSSSNRLEPNQTTTSKALCRCLR